jgi:hypothetical protein
MPLPTIPGVFRCALNWTHDDTSNTATNVIHVHSLTADEQGVFDALDAAVDADQWGFSSNGAQIHEVVITKLDGTPDGVVFPTNDSVDWQGGGGTDFIPQASALVKLTTAQTGRSGRGRVYLPWLVEGQQNGGVLDSTQRGITQSGWENFVNDLPGGLGLGALGLVVASYKLESAAKVTAVLVETMSATQRKRQQR